MMNNTNANLNNAIVNTETANAKVKFTKKDNYLALLDIVGKAKMEKDTKSRLETFINRELELLAKKSNASGSKANKEVNDKLEKVVVTVLKEMKEAVTVSTLLEDGRLASYEIMEKGEKVTKKMSSQKLSALLSKMVKDKKVLRVEDKKKALFKVA